MTFDSLFNLLNEAQFFKKPHYSRKETDYEGKIYDVGRKQSLQKPAPTTGIPNLEEFQRHLDVLFNKYGFYFSNLEDLDRKLAGEDSTMIFRGHKTINPFSKDSDTKSPRDTVYWAKQPKNALAFALVSNTGGTSGRSFKNLLNSAYENRAGFLSVAYAKYPQSLVWYKDFGVEREKQDSERYRKTYGKGLDYSEHSGTSEYPSYRMDRNNPNSSPKQFHRAETALSPHEVSKLKTFVWKGDPSSGISLLNINKIKEANPELYKILYWNRFG
jgi:hypothetical protein